MLEAIGQERGQMVGQGEASGFFGSRIPRIPGNLEAWSKRNVLAVVSSHAKVGVSRCHECGYTPPMVTVVDKDDS